jgi:hypothetical protein
MKASRMGKISAAAIVVIALALTLTVLSSLRFSTDPSGGASFMARTQQKFAPGIGVDVSALGASESRQFFGEDLAGHNIQPVWLSVENETDDQFIFLPIAMDPDYYSPYEVSYRFHSALSLAANRARDGDRRGSAVGSLFGAGVLSSSTGLI